jgi:hypothetical protein
MGLAKVHNAQVVPATPDGMVQRSLASVPTARLLRQHAKALLASVRRVGSRSASRGHYGTCQMPHWQKPDGLPGKISGTTEK